MAKTPKDEKAARLAADVLAGDRRALALALTVMESGRKPAAELYARIGKRIGNALVVGFTGPPGCGKSTLINAYVTEMRRRGKTVAIAAVDPSSPVSGGSILGDRLRMTDHTGDKGVFIRSFPSGGHLGGLTAHIDRVIDLLDAAGWDIIVVETVGTGQSEVDVADLAHVKIVINVPGLGDDIQALKAGILEIADILVVNKADLPSADAAVLQLDAMLHMRAASRKNTPVYKTVALSGEGVDALADEIESRERPRDGTARKAARRTRLRRLLTRAAVRLAGSEIDALPEGEFDKLTASVLDGTLELDKAAATLLSKVEPKT